MDIALSRLQNITLYGLLLDHLPRLMALTLQPIWGAPVLSVALEPGTCPVRALFSLE